MSCARRAGLDRDCNFTGSVAFPVVTARVLTWLGSLFGSGLQAQQQQQAVYVQAQSQLQAAARRSALLAAIPPRCWPACCTAWESATSR